MKTRLLAMALIAGGSMFAQTRFSIGVGIGGYAPPPAYYSPAPTYAEAAPPCPGPGFTWVDGYWSNNAWTAGYWAPPASAYAYGPRYEDHNYRRDYDRDDYRRFDRGREFREHNRDFRGYDRGFRDHDRGYRNDFRGR